MTPVETYEQTQDDAARVTVWDNGGETFDRYTVAIRLPEEHGGVYYLGIGETGNVPNGFCMHVGGPEAVMEGEHLGAVLSLDEMSEAARRAVVSELRFVDRELAALSTAGGTGRGTR